MSTDVREWIERRLEGRSWNWLGRSLAEPVTGNAVRAWADGVTPLPAYRADQISAALGVDPDELRRVAGLPEREPTVRPMPGTATERAALLAQLERHVAVRERNLDSLPIETLRVLEALLTAIDTAVDAGEAQSS